MKIKCRPEDFRVEELARLEPGGRGRFGLYMLEKRGLSTFEAIGRLARHLGRPAKSISAGGLKDKHAVTRQHLTVSGKPVGEVKLAGLKLSPLGRCEEPMTGAQLLGNRFRIILRDVPADAIESVRGRARLAARQGLPNYFDEQRFGSFRGKQGFIARRLIDADFEGALRLHLAAPGRLDASRERAARRRASELWGKWAELHAKLPRGSARKIVGHLRDHPGAFLRAFEMLEPRLAQLYLFAYQSYLWNETLAGLLARSLDSEALFEIRYAPGRLTFFDEVTESSLAGLHDLNIPLPCPGADYGSGPLAESAREALEAEGLALDRLRVEGSKKLRFRGGERPALVSPGELLVGKQQPDDLYSGRYKLRLDFTMPPGSYATLLVKFVGRELLPGSRRARKKQRRGGTRA